MNAWACALAVALSAVVVGASRSEVSGEGAPAITEEALTDGRTSARQSGGEFSDEGWTATSPEDHLLYVLEEGRTEGAIEFEVRGIELGRAGVDARQHMFGLWDSDQTRYVEQRDNGLLFRIYWAEYENHRPGETRLRINGPAFGKHQADTRSLSWEAGRWYHMRFAWADTWAAWYRDGQLMKRVTFKPAPVRLRYAFINGMPYKDMLGSSGVTYRNVKLFSQVGTEPGTAPTDKR